jgi:hypothetical protein
MEPLVGKGSCDERVIERLTKECLIKTVAGDLFRSNVAGKAPIFEKAYKRNGFGETASKGLLDDPGICRPRRPCRP